MGLRSYSKWAFAIYVGLTPISDVVYFHPRFPMYAPIGGRDRGVALVVLVEGAPADPFRYTAFPGIEPAALERLNEGPNSMQYLTHELQMHVRDHRGEGPAEHHIEIGYRQHEVEQGRITTGPLVVVASGHARRA